MNKNIIIYTIFFLFISCAPGGGTTTGNPVTIEMSFSSYENSLISKLSNIFISPAHASLSELKFCFKRVRFKVYDSSVGKDLELELGEVSINQEGTDLGTVEIADAIYRRIEFDIAKNCDGDNQSSVTILNDNGTFSTDDGITIRFDGEFKANEGGELVLIVQNVVNGIKNYKASDGEIKDILENLSGTF